MFDPQKAALSYEELLNDLGSEDTTDIVSSYTVGKSAYGATPRSYRQQACNNRVSVSPDIGGLLNQCAQTRTVICKRNTKNDKQYVHMADKTVLLDRSQNLEEQQHVENLVIVPLISPSGVVQGCLSVCNTSQDEEMSFLEHDIILICALSQRLSVFLQDMKEQTISRTMLRRQYEVSFLLN
jgi:hypothetical protein